MFCIDFPKLIEKTFRSCNKIEVFLYFLPATDLFEVSEADRIRSFSEFDPSITPNKLQEAKL